jgi:acyl-CoA thioesterase I
MLRRISLVAFVRIPMALCALALVVAFVVEAAPALGSSAAAMVPATPVKSPQAETVIVFIGDSLTQGYGVRSEESYPSLVGRNLKRDGYNVKTINGGISGSVTAEADARVRWYLKVKPKIIVLALGANDGMKGTPASVIESNLKKAIDLAHENGITVLLSGLRMFSNLGPAYVSSFEAIFPRLAKEKHLPLIPFLLEDVALQKELNQSDMRHPNAKGHELIASRVTAKLEEILKGGK